MMGTRHHKCTARVPIVGNRPRKGRSRHKSLAEHRIEAMGGQNASGELGEFAGFRPGIVSDINRGIGMGRLPDLSRRISNPRDVIKRKRAVSSATPAVSPKMYDCAQAPTPRYVWYK